MKIYIKGLNSCAMRRQNLLHYQQFLSANGHNIIENPREADIILVWTCGFRRDVLQNSVDVLVKLESEYDAEIVAIGCLPDIDRHALKNGFNGKIIPWKNEADIVNILFGPVTARFEELRPVFAEQAKCEDAAMYRKKNPDTDVTFHDQFIKLLISEGCPFKCTYCTERLAFPPFRSFPASELVEECQRLTGESGNDRVILLADSLGAYGRDIGTNLPELLAELRKAMPNLKFALNNMHPISFIEFIDEMENFLKQGWIAHLNLPIQSASNQVLSAMDRIYTRKQLDEVFGLLNNIGFKEFDTHIIVGFPGEDENAFTETIDFLIKYSPKYVLMSAYYESKNAPSAKLLNKVDKETVRKRIDRAKIAFENAGIICNFEGSDIGLERLRRLNLLEY